MSTITELHYDTLVQPALRVRPWRAAAAKASSIAATTALVVAMSILLTLALFRVVGGYQPAVMLTGSMAPLINPGDVIITKTTPLEDIRVGDVITYGIPVEDNRTVTHRVAEVLTDEAGATAVRTKGDANPNPDYWTAVLTGTTASKHVFTIPQAGTAIRFLREPAVLNATLYGAPVVLATWLVVNIWRNPKDGPSIRRRSLPGNDSH